MHVNEKLFESKYSVCQFNKGGKTIETYDIRDKKKMRQFANTEPREELHKGKIMPWRLQRTVKRIKISRGRTKKIGA